MTSTQQIAKVTITRDMTIGEVIERYPSLAEVLTAEGVHCVGCGAAYWETIEQGLAGHGMEDARIDAIVRKLNDEIPVELGTLGELVITERAVTKLKEIMEKKEKIGMGLRVTVKPGGCSGKTYGFEFSEKANANDKVVEINGAQFFVDPFSFSELKGATIDYLDTLQGAGFTIYNPNASSSCGCGKSFN
ncbi:MAG: iron-sulfur cluster assembly accessory protein [bacterium]